MRLTFVAGTAFILFMSCKKEKSNTSISEPDQQPTHPWDWTPDDFTLLAGKKIYQAECSGCHNEGEEGAPALTKIAEWSKRAAKGTVTLYDHAINGYDGIDGEMPARGGTPSLTDEQVKNAVQFMLQASQQ